MSITQTIAGVRARQRADGKFVPTASAALDLLFPSKAEYMDLAAMERGERCHYWMAAWLRHKIDWKQYQPPIPLENVAEQARCNAAVFWYDSMPFQSVLAVEQSLWSKGLQWSGTPDALLVTTKMKTVCIDWKFAESLNERYLVQGEAYRHLCPHKINEVLLVQINAKAEVKTQKVKPDLIHYAAFLSAVNVCKWRLRNV